MEQDVIQTSAFRLVLFWSVEVRGSWAYLFQIWKRKQTLYNFVIWNKKVESPRLFTLPIAFTWWQVMRPTLGKFTTERDYQIIILN